MKWRLQKITEQNFPKDNYFLKDISKIKITFENSLNLENLPFCYKSASFIDPEKSNKCEKYIIFSSCLQMNLLTNTTQILIDGTFKACPPGFYQILNIAAFYSDIDSIIPIFMIPMTE